MQTALPQVGIPCTNQQRYLYEMQELGLNANCPRTAVGKDGTVSNEFLMAPSPSGVPSQVPSGLFSNMLPGLPSEMASQMPSDVPLGQATPLPASQIPEEQPYGQTQPDLQLSSQAHDLQQPALRAQAGREWAGAAMQGVARLTESVSRDVDQRQGRASSLRCPCLIVQHVHDWYSPDNGCQPKHAVFALHDLT